MKKTDNKKERLQYMMKSKYGPEGIRRTVTVGEKYLSKLNNKYQEKEDIILFDPSNPSHVNAKVDYILGVLKQFGVEW